MSKWADFVITSVKYDNDHSCIVKVKRCVDEGENLGTTAEKTRAAVVDAIENKGFTYVTAYKKDGKWHKGQDVHIIKIDGKKYLRTDANKTTKDNLGELPEF